MKHNLKQIFEKIAGPPLPEKLPLVASAAVSMYREHLHYLLDQVNSTSPVMSADIQVGLVDTLSLNAVAYSDDAYELVGINAGFAIVLPLVAAWLLSHPGVFPEIGDPDRETEPAPLDLSFLAMSGKVSEMTDDHWETWVAMPSDPTRQHFVGYISMAAWDFLLLHELGHINRCHIPYLASRPEPFKAAGALFEFGESLSKEKAATRRMLEVDADGFAGRVLGGGFILNGLGKARFMAFGNDEPWDWPSAYKAWLRPVGLLFSLMVIIEGNIGINELHRTHPHPDVRMQVLVNSVWPRWSEVIPDRTRFIQLTREAGGEMRDIFRRGILPSPSSRFDQAYSESFRHRVLDLWSALQDEAEELNSMTMNRLSIRRKLLGQEG